MTITTAPCCGKVQTRSVAFEKSLNRRLVARYSHEIGSVFVDHGAERQPVPERRGHVGDGHIPVSVTLDFAPLLESFNSRHPELKLNSCELSENHVAMSSPWTVWRREEVPADRTQSVAPASPISQPRPGNQKDWCEK